MDIIPILKIDDILILTIQTELYDKIAVELQGNILEKIYANRARGLIIDITAIDIVDSFLGRILSDTAIMAKIMGVETVLVGVRSEIAITLQELGLELKGIHTALDLEKGIDFLKNIINEKDP